MDLPDIQHLILSFMRLHDAAQHAGDPALFPTDGFIGGDYDDAVPFDGLDIGCIKNMTVAPSRFCHSYAYVVNYVDDLLEDGFKREDLIHIDVVLSFATLGGDIMDLDLIGCLLDHLQVSDFMPLTFTKLIDTDQLDLWSAAFYPDAPPEIFAPGFQPILVKEYTNTSDTFVRMQDDQGKPQAKKNNKKKQKNRNTLLA